MICFTILEETAKSCKSNIFYKLFKSKTKIFIRNSWDVYLFSAFYSKTKW